MKKSWNWVIFYSFFISINIILFIALLGFTETSLFDLPDVSSIFKLSLLVLFFFVNSVLVTWEILQFKSNSSEYFSDPMNRLYCLRIIFTSVWIVFDLFSLYHLKFTWIVVFLNLLRGITVFRLFDDTRYYITLIIRALNDIKYFIIIFIYSTFSFGVLFLISRSQVLSLIHFEVMLMGWTLGLLLIQKMMQIILWTTWSLLEPQSSRGFDAIDFNSWRLIRTISSYSSNHRL